MEEHDKELEKKVNKIPWTYNFDNLKEANYLRKESIKSCQRLEEEGFGMLEDPDNPGKIDSSCSVVSPDGEVFTQEQINNYLIARKGGFNSENPEDMKMHNVNMYYFGFKEGESNL